MDALQFYPSSALADLGLGVTRSFLWLLSRLATTAHWLPLRSSERAPWELVLGFGLLVLAILLVRRQPHPVSAWAIWTVLMLVPFALLTDSILLVLHVCPSRYLYFASAGSSLVLA